MLLTDAFFVLNLAILILIRTFTSQSIYSLHKLLDINYRHFNHEGYYAPICRLVLFNICFGYNHSVSQQKKHLANLLDVLEWMN